MLKALNRMTYYIIFKYNMHTTTLRKVGGSVMLAVPPALLDILRARSGDRIDIDIENGRLVAQPQRRRRYSLNELLAQCNPKAKAGRSREERDWVSGKSVGRELI